MLAGLNEAALAELEGLRTEAGGMLLPEAVVQRARSSNSALHKYFEWDDSEAAVAYRMQQARRVIRTVVRIVERPNAPATQVRAFISLPSDRATTGGYRAVEEIMSDEAMLAEAVRDLRRTILRIRVKYGAIAAVSGLVGRVADVLHDLPQAAE